MIKLIFLINLIYVRETLAQKCDFAYVSLSPDGFRRVRHIHVPQESSGNQGCLPKFSY